MPLPTVSGCRAARWCTPGCWCRRTACPSSLMSLFSMEREAGGQGPAQRPQAFQSFLLPPVAAHLEFPITGDQNLNLITFLECQSLDDGCGKPNRQAVAPF